MNSPADVISPIGLKLLYADSLKCGDNKTFKAFNTSKTAAKNTATEATFNNTQKALG